MLQLPQLRDRFNYTLITVSQNTGSAQSRLQPHVATFCSDYSHRTLVLDAIAASSRPQTLRQDFCLKYRLALSSKVVLSHLVNATTGHENTAFLTWGALILPWTDWGQDARLLVSGSLRLMDSCVLDVCNTRCLLSIPTERGGITLHTAMVYDFGPVPALLENVRDEVNGKGPAGQWGVPPPVLFPSEKLAPGVFEGQGTMTAAPGRLTIPEIEIDPSQHTLRIYEDGIVKYEGEGRNAKYVLR